MRFNDLLVYAIKINKQNKKESAIIIFGLVFSIVVFLVFLLFYFVLFSIYSSINSSHNLLSVRYFENVDGYKIQESNIEESISSIDYNLDFYTRKRKVGFHVLSIEYPELYIDGEQKFYYDSFKSDYFWDKDRFVFFADSKIFLNSEIAYLKDNNLGDPILAGTTFTSKKNEIMVGSDLLDGFGIIDYNSVIGKKITYNTKLFNNCSIDEDGKIDTYDIKVKKNDEYNDLTEEYIEYSYDVFSDFVIVGVFNSNIYKCPSRCSVYSPNGEIYNYSRFWFKEEAISKIYYEYELVYDSYEDEYYEKYDSLVFEDELKNILDTTNGFRIITGKEITNPINQTYYLQFNDIESLYNFYNEIVGYEISNYFEINYSVKAYLDFLPTYKTLKSILTILLLILVLLIIMNLIRTLDYSIHRKMDFYIMLKNIGLEYKNIIGMYYCSILGNYLMSVLVSANLFIPLSIIHYNVTKNVLSNYGNWIIFDINIWGYFIIFIFVVFLLLFMFSMVAIMILLIYKKKFKKGVLSND